MAEATKKKKASKTAKTTTTKKKSTRRKSAEPQSRGLDATAVGEVERTPSLVALTKAIETDGGAVIGTYRDPLGGHACVIAALPIEAVEPTPFQRDLSATHVKRLTEVIDKLDRFLDPIITVRTDEGRYWTPNGNHRFHSMKALGARSIVALVVPDREIAYKILALNTEKAHNLKEKALEVIRMARSLADLDDRAESTYALEFEEPALLTLGICYEQRPRYSGGAYNPILKRLEKFSDEPLSESLQTRTARAEALLALDDAVAAAVAALKERGFESPYLKAFVVARINPLRFKKGEAEFDEIITKMTESAQNFDVSKVRADQVAQTGGAPGEE